MIERKPGKFHTSEIMVRRRGGRGGLGGELGERCGGRCRGRCCLWACEEARSHFAQGDISVAKVNDAAQVWYSHRLNEISSFYSKV